MLYRSLSEDSATPGRRIVEHMRQRSLDASRFCFAIPTEATATDAVMQSHREKVTKNNGIPANRGTPTVHISGLQSSAPHKMGSRTQPERSPPQVTDPVCPTPQPSSPIRRVNTSAGHDDCRLSWWAKPVVATARVVSSNHGVERWSHGTALHARIQPESLATPDFMSHTVAGHKTSQPDLSTQERSRQRPACPRHMKL